MFHFKGVRTRNAGRGVENWKLQRVFGVGMLCCAAVFTLGLHPVGEGFLCC